MASFSDDELVWLRSAYRLSYFAGRVVHARECAMEKRVGCGGNNEPWLLSVRSMRLVIRSELYVAMRLSASS